jgi:hypothetical protein
MRVRSFVVLGLLALFAPEPGLATHPASCPDGSWYVDGPPIFPTPIAALDTILIDHGQVSILSGGCPAVPATFTRADDGTLYLRAAWRRCAQARRVSLKATIDPTCTRMQGVVVSGRPSFTRRFTADPCADPAGCVQPCSFNEHCAATDYCAKAPGDCLGSGQCRTRPQACPDVWQPVCGCDRRTYSNACDAAAAGVNVIFEGECPDRCDVTSPCPEGEFCELPPGVCASALDAGHCVKPPELCLNDFCSSCNEPICPACPQIYLPVCGCDGVTYTSECERQKARVSKAHDGPCSCPQILCAPGTEPVDRDGDGCAETCLAPCRDVCDCKVNPDISLRNDCPMLCPTCGNHWTCQNGHCVEECGPTPIDECRLCGGIAGLPCPDGAICDLPAGQCSSADLFGTCRLKPDACIQVWDPVCGCDGQTYSNDCVRLGAGAQKDHDGACRLQR